LTFEQQARAAAEIFSMSLPRQVVRGRTYMITRRCTQRLLLLRPDADTTNAFICCLALAAQQTEVQVLFFHAMSNHYHAGIVGPAGGLHPQRGQADRL
jgi:putative transposase